MGFKRCVWNCQLVIARYEYHRKTYCVVINKRPHHEGVNKRKCLDENTSCNSYSSGGAKIPNELFEAAKIDGATSLKVFRFIIFPLLIPYILLSLILRTTFAIREFDLVWLLTGGGPVNTTELISSFSYKQAFSLFEAGYASALSVILLLITFSITFIYVIWNCD